MKDKNSISELLATEGLSRTRCVDVFEYAGFVERIPADLNNAAGYRVTEKTKISYPGQWSERKTVRKDGKEQRKVTFDRLGLKESMQHFKIFLSGGLSVQSFSWSFI